LSLHETQFEGISMIRPRSFAWKHAWLS